MMGTQMRSKYCEIFKQVGVYNTKKAPSNQNNRCHSKASPYFTNVLRILFPIWFHIIYKLFLSHCTRHCDQGVLASMYMLLNYDYNLTIFLNRHFVCLHTAEK